MCQLNDSYEHVGFNNGREAIIGEVIVETASELPSATFFDGFELLASLENAIDRRDKAVSNSTNNARMEKKFEFKKNNKNFNGNETKDDE